MHKGKHKLKEVNFIGSPEALKEKMKKKVKEYKHKKKALIGLYAHKKDSVFIK